VLYLSVLFFFPNAWRDSVLLCLSTLLLFLPLLRFKHQPFENVHLGCIPPFCLVLPSLYTSQIPLPSLLRLNLSLSLASVFIAYLGKIQIILFISSRDILDFALLHKLYVKCANLNDGPSLPITNLHRQRYIYIFAHCIYLDS